MSFNKLYLREYLLYDYLKFVRYFFKIKYGKKIQLNQHVVVQCRVLQDVVDGKIQHLITNIAPGYSKSTLHGEFFFPYIMAKYPHAQNILLSYGQTVAQTISQAAKSVIELPEYQDLFTFKFRRSQDAKGLWKNELEGGLLATSSGGVVTGFNAGTVDDLESDYTFNGLLMLDDPQKPDDIYSENYRLNINDNFTNTVKNRVRSPKTPIIIVMQRLHYDDLCGWLLRGGTEIKWHHLILPAVIDNSKSYPINYTHGKKIEHNLPNGALWEYKLTAEKFNEMKQYSPYMVAAQYEQDPINIGAGIFKDAWWQYYDVMPNFEYKLIAADTAQKTKEHNDYTVFQAYGIKDFNIYLIEQLRGKWEAPELERNFIDFYNKHKGNNTQTTGRLRGAIIEEASSGTGLIQNMQRRNDMIIYPKIRTKDKLTRAMDTVPYVAQGRVFLPSEAPYLFDFKKEFRDFSANDTHQHDDQIDPLMDVVDHVYNLDNNRSTALWT
jgi:predicted phage terminase large subunit-like protein